MKKVVCFGLCFLVVLSSFVFCFADGGTASSPYMLPVGDVNDISTGLSITYGSDIIRYYRCEKSPVYLIFYYDGSRTNILTFSDSPNNSVYFNDNHSSTGNTWRLNNVHDGYYYSQSVSSIPPDSYILPGVFNSPSDVIDYVEDSVFSVSFSISSLVEGSSTWLSSMAQAVKGSGLLLFIVLFSFVGIGIGLFRRFTNG